MGSIPFSRVVPILMTSILYEDLSSGILYNVSQGWNDGYCSTYAAHVYSSKSNHHLNDSRCALPIPLEFTQNISFCAGAVKSLHYNIYHGQDSTSAITSVTADVIITTVPFAEVARYVQTISVSFFEVGEARSARSSSSGNLVNRYGELLHNPSTYCIYHSLYLFCIHIELVLETLGIARKPPYCMQSIPLI